MSGVHGACAAPLLCLRRQHTRAACASVGGGAPTHPRAACVGGGAHAADVLTRLPSALALRAQGTFSEAGPGHGSESVLISMYLDGEANASLAYYPYELGGLPSITAYNTTCALGA